MVKSPCINVCKMEKDLCAGCFRTIGEIASWATADDEDKQLIVAAAERRRLQRGPDVDLVCHSNDV